MIDLLLETPLASAPLAGALAVASFALASAAVLAAVRWVESRAFYIEVDK